MIVDFGPINRDGHEHILKRMIEADTSPLRVLVAARIKKGRLGRSGAAERQRCKRHIERG